MKLLTLFCFLFSSSLLQAQQDKITATLIEYFGLIEQKQISEALDYVHPELINMLGKSTFEQQYNQLFSTPGIEVDMADFSVDTLSNVHESQSKKYVLVDYSFLMTFKVDVSDDESGLLPGILLSSYKSKFGSDNVTSDTPGTYLIRVEREMFAVKSSSFEGWKIIDFEEGMRIMVVNIIPDDVLKHFNR